MSHEIDLVQGDTGPDIDFTLTDPNNDNAPLDVSTATVRFYFRKIGASALTATIVCTKPNGGTDGVVRVSWPAGALAAAGKYEGEIEIDNGVTTRTVYRKQRFDVRPQIG